MSPLRSEPNGPPAPVRAAALGAVLLGVPSAVVGLVIGLHVYAPTAWAATVEVGLPGAAVGALLGLVVGLAVRGRGARSSGDRQGPAR